MLALALALLAAAPAAAQIPAGNLITNPGAEAAPGAISTTEVAALPGWTVESSFTAVQYGAEDFPTSEQSATWGGGANFFAGGPGSTASGAFQIVDVSAARRAIDDGRVSVTVAALLGGWEDNEDVATVTAIALNNIGVALGSAELPAVTAAERESLTTLLPRSATAPVPRGTRRFSVRVAATRALGVYNDGYADNISLTLTAAGETPDTPDMTEVTPAFHRTVVVRRISGAVRVRRPGSRRFVALGEATDIPLGSAVDARRGVVALTSVPRRDGNPETARFSGGIFDVRQPGGITELRLTEALRRCSRTRRLRGDGEGSFRTRGRFSATTVREGRWLVRDSCAGTLTRVSAGVVSVRDRVRGRTRIVRAGERYLARPRR